MLDRENPCITVATGSCGRAAGAEDTMAAIISELRRLGMSHVNVKQVGCRGMCEVEPLVSVKMPGDEEILYGKVDTETARRIVANHLRDGKIVTDRVVQLAVH